MWLYARECVNERTKKKKKPLQDTSRPRSQLSCLAKVYQHKFPLIAATFALPQAVGTLAGTLAPTDTQS
jgi:hypothetical protein